MIKKHTVVYIIFGMVALLDILSGQFFPNLRYFSKPLLMPLLMLAYYFEVKRIVLFSRILLSGLFFSWAGDILLMFESFNGFFFIGGLLSFLTAHLMYIRYFSKTNSVNEPYLKSRPVMLLAIVAYVIELMYILWPYLGEMKVPVVIYASVIGLMLAFALWQVGKLDKKSAGLFVAGAAFFILSDSLLAINKFRSSFAYAGPAIMFTYCLAQYLLVRGSARHLETISTTANE
jgi:uncharacterized membrane protein YhhN